MGSPGAGTQGQLHGGWTVLCASPQVEKIRKAITSLDPVLRTLPDIRLLKVQPWARGGERSPPHHRQREPPSPSLAVPTPGGLRGGVPGPGAAHHPHLHRAQLQRVPPARPDLQAGLPQEPQGTALPLSAPLPQHPPAAPHSLQAGRAAPGAGHRTGAACTPVGLGRGPRGAAAG